MDEMLTPIEENSWTCLPARESIASYVYFTDWAEQDRRWQEMDGHSLICWTEQDRYGVLGFDRIIEIFDLKETLKEERCSAKVRSKENTRLKKQQEKL